MLHLLVHEPETPAPYAEAISRLASVRHALRLVDNEFAGGPEDDLDIEIAAAWPISSEAKQRCFNRRSERLVGTAAAGIEALLDQRHQGNEPHLEASRTLVDQIRFDLRSVAGVVLA